ATGRAIRAPASSEAAAPVRAPAAAQPPGRAPAAVAGAGRPQGVRASQRPVPASSRASAPDVTRARATASVPAPRSAPAPARAPADQRGTYGRDHVMLVPGGRDPGRRDHFKRDRARAVLPLGGPRLVAVVGCTVGAGQTVTALIAADLLASLRREAVAALD